MRDARKLIKTIVLVVVLGGVAAYGLFEFRGFLGGPQIAVASPVDGATLTEEMVEVSGLTEHISKITLNGRPIFIDESGAFAERIPLLSGYNVLTLEAVDRFGNETRETREVVYRPAEQPVAPKTETATTTEDVGLEENLM